MAWPALDRQLGIELGDVEAGEGFARRGHDELRAGVDEGRVGDHAVALSPQSDPQELSSSTPAEL